MTRFDWLAVFKKLDNEEWCVVHNDAGRVAEFLSEMKPWLCGFNVKHYDQYILKAVLGGLSPEEVKEVNDFIIGGGNGWDCPLTRDIKCWIEQIDLMDDCQVGTSLKSFEAHYGMDITETTVAFDIDRAWTDEELERMAFYCKADVRATETLFHLRENYLMTKIRLGGMVGMTPQQSCRVTNAMMTARFLNATAKAYDDERKYVYPANLRREYIPQEVFDFFDRMYDDSVSDEELFHSKLDITIGDTPVTLGFGGIHGAVQNHVFKECGA